MDISNGSFVVNMYFLELSESNMGVREGKN